MGDIEDILKMAQEIERQVQSMPLRTHMEKELLFYFLWRASMFQNDQNNKRERDIEQISLFKHFFRKKQ